MENLYLPNTSKTPEINFKLNGDLTIKGISTPENVIKFYDPIIIWVHRFKDLKPEKVSLTFDLDYINSSSSKVLIDFIEYTNVLKEDNIDVEINWFYYPEDEDIFELGEKFQLNTSNKINFVKKYDEK